MNSFIQIRAALVARLRTVPGIGVVHEYERFAAKAKDFSRLYMQGNDICGFFVRRQSYQEQRYSSQYNKIITRWLIQGFASLQDAKATELVFDNLIDAMAKSIRERPVLTTEDGKTLCHTVTDNGAGLQEEDSGPVMFAGALCHSVKLSLTTEHYIEIETGVSDPDVCDKPALSVALDAQDVTAPEISATFKPRGAGND